MNRYRIASRILTAAICLVVVASIAMSVIYSQAISSIKVTALDERKEPRDAAVIGLGKEKSLPDYRLEIVDRSNKAIDLGTIPNRSAVGGLTWKCDEIAPRRTAKTLRLIEQDPLEPDMVEEIAIADDRMESDNYRYQLQCKRSLRVGAIFFLFSTPVGWVLVGLFVLLGMALASNIVVPN